MVASSPVRTKVFISYSHQDIKFLERLRVHLAPFIGDNLFEIWDDTHIKPGAEWREEILRVIASAKIAVLLISADYLASSFIADNELLPLLTAAAQEGILILSVILRPCDFMGTSLSQFQAVNSPSRPLSKLSSNQREEVWAKVAEIIENTITTSQESTSNKQAQVNSKREDNKNRDISTPSVLVEGDQEASNEGVKSLQGTISSSSVSQAAEVTQPSQMSSTPRIDPLASAIPSPNLHSPASPDLIVNPVAQAIVTQGCFETGSVEQKATSDMPAQTLKQDKLGFAIYVRAFRDFIASQDTSTPLTIGIYGAWGSGKSSLMHMIKNELDPPLDSLSKRWLRRLWWQWFRSHLWTLRPWLSAKLKLWRDDRRGRAQIYRNTCENQPAITSSQSSATSNQGNQPNNNANNVGTSTASPSANQNSTDSNLIGQTNNVTANHADPAQDGHRSSPGASASTTNGQAGSTQHDHDDSRILDKIGGPRRFQKIREDLSYTPAMPQKVEDATKFQKMRAGLSYDPSTTDKRLDHLTDPVERRWAIVAAAHCPMVPLTHPTIWFNAWKFDQEEQLWAALALEVMNQIKQKYGYAGRVLFWVRLTWKRSSHLAAFWSIIWKFVLPVVLLVITVVYTLYLTSITNATASLHIYDFLGPFSPKGPYAPLIPLILLAGAIISGIPAVKIIKDPFQIPVKDILDKPNYKDKVGFIGDFEKDFARIVSVATRRHFGWKPQKLVIFIDDMDRCEPPKAADIIEGINLFLDSDRCVFVLGMDPNAVAASIENKYNDLFGKRQNWGTKAHFRKRAALSSLLGLGDGNQQCSQSCKPLTECLPLLGKRYSFS